MKAMKAHSAMKGARVMKRKSISKTAKGRLAKALVLRGSKVKTTGGLKADDLMKNKRGKIVSKRQSALGKRRFQNIEGWVEAHMSARKALQVTGFCAINGKTLQGKAIYVKAKAIMAGNARSQIAASPAPVKERVPEEKAVDAPQ